MECVRERGGTRPLPKCRECATYELWRDIKTAVDQVIDNRSLQDMIDNYLRKNQDDASFGKGRKLPVECQAVNLEAGMPTVDVARIHLNMALCSAKANRVKVLKLIHGYGSSGRGGAILGRCSGPAGPKKTGGADSGVCAGRRFFPV